MKKKNIIIFVVILLMIIVVGGFLDWKNKQKSEVSYEQSRSENHQQQSQKEKLENKTQNQQQVGDTLEQNEKLENVDMGNWEIYKNDKYGFKIKHPKDWIVQSYDNKKSEVEDSGIDISWQGNRITLFPIGKQEPSCYSRGAGDHFERLTIDKYEEEFFVKEAGDGKLYECADDIDNYPKSWSEKAFIEMEYNANVSSTIKNILQSISFLESPIDQASLKLYGSRVGVQGKGGAMNISNWLTKENKIVDFSFRYPRNVKIIDEGNCYRVEYGLGFVIFFLPIEGDMRCGSRTGVGMLPDNVHVTDYLTIKGERYEASGFNAVIDTKGEEFFKSETRYFYDFHHMFDLNKKEDCGNAGECKRVAYGIYKEAETPLSKDSIDDTMHTLRAIIESVKTDMQ